MTEKKVYSKPNLIYILADDLGYGDLSIYGQEKFTTPNIDKLARQGMLFTQHYSGSTVCAPSRSSLMTGMHTGHIVVRGNKEIRPEGQYPIPENTREYSFAIKLSTTNNPFSFVKTTLFISLIKILIPSTGVS